MSESGTDSTPEPEDQREGATLLVAFYIANPGIDLRVDPEELADELRDMVNDSIRGGYMLSENDMLCHIEVSAIPAAQWLTPETLQIMRSVNWDKTQTADQS